MNQDAWSERLKQAVAVGMVAVNDEDSRATILAPARAEEMSDDDWLLVIRAASEVRRELTQLGYRVDG